MRSNPSIAARNNFWWMTLYLQIPHLYRMSGERELASSITNSASGKLTGDESHNPDTQMRMRQQAMDVGAFVDHGIPIALISTILILFNLGLLQPIISEAVSDSIARTLASVAVVFAFWSAVYGSFNTILFRGAITTWAKNPDHNGLAFWNVWVMLSLPAIFLAWSSLLSMTTVIWLFLTNLNDKLSEMALWPTSGLGWKIIVVLFWAIGLLYFVLTATTSVRMRP